MYHSFFTISDALAARCVDYSIVTANERLAAEIKRSLEAHLAAGQKPAWPTVDVISYRQFFLRAWRQSRVDRNSVARLLDERYLRNLAYTTAPEQRHNLNEFVTAWRTIDDYDVDLTHPLFERRELGPFTAWTRTVAQATTGLVSEGRIPDELCEMGFQPPKPLILVGFDQYTHPQRRYFDWIAGQQELLTYESLELRAWQVANTTSVDAVKRSPESIISVRAAYDLRDELRHAAHWARATKLAQPDATIGIVVPELAQQYDLVLNQCSAILDPHGGRQSTTFDIAGGKPLEHQPVWQHALAILHGYIDGWSQPLLRQVASSPYLAADRLSAAALQWPVVRPLCSTAELADKTGAPQLEALAALCSAQPEKQTYARWCNSFSDMLGLFNWPETISLGSGQYQAAQRIRKLLGNDAESAESGQDIACGEALYLLNLDLRGQLFSPERPAADIRILGLLETTGLTFSHLWVCGLDENNFPGAATASPFVPQALCQQFGVPRSSQAAELEFAQRLLSQWQTSAGQLVVSYTDQFEDSEQRLSSLVSARTTQMMPSSNTPVLFYRAVRQQIELVASIDFQGTPVTEVNVRGGTGLISAQAACPFRAYSQYRLNLRRPEHAAHYPDGLRRGTLLHLILQRLLTAYPTQESLLDVDAEEISELCKQILLGQHGYLPEAYVRHEVIRLTGLILEWLVVEAQRQPFVNVAVESAHELRLGELQLKIRIDRIDRPRGRHESAASADRDDSGENRGSEERWIVIDYKTGQVRLPATVGARLTEPQLPLYSLADERIEGVYFGQIRAAGARLTGLADEGVALTGARTAKNRADWHTQRQSWRKELTRLAQEFQRGYAVVDPAPGACSYCHLASLCRIAQSGTDDADGQLSD